MKLTELYEAQGPHGKTLDTEEEITNWISHVDSSQKYHINIDASVDVDGDVTLEGKKLRFIHVEYGNVTGNFSVFENELTTLINSPKTVGGDFTFERNKSVKTFEGAPRSIGEDLICVETGLTTLHDIHKYIKEIGRDIIIDHRIKGSMLGLLKIKRLKRIKIHNYRKSYNQFNTIGAVVAIINKYLPEGDMLACVDELTDAGFEEFAKL